MFILLLAAIHLVEVGLGLASQLYVRTRAKASVFGYQGPIHRELIPIQGRSGDSKAHFEKHCFGVF